MTTIAYDGKSLAVDRRSTRNGLIGTATKIRRLPTGEVVAMVGILAHALELLHWYICGAEIRSYPSGNSSNGECPATLVVADGRGCRTYWGTAFPVECEEPFTAWGSGRDFAIAAMACGKTAAEAVEIAARFDTDTGGGVDVMELTGVGV